MSRIGKRIFLIENDPDTLFLLKTVLGEAGYFVECFTEGSGLLDRRQSWPDLFIVNQELPAIDGIAITKFLRIFSETERIPIIMTSDYPIKAKASKAGVDAFIEKPFELNNLLSLVTECLPRLYLDRLKVNE